MPGLKSRTFCGRGKGGLELGKLEHRPWVYVPLRLLFLVYIIVHRGWSLASIFTKERVSQRHNNVRNSLKIL